MKNSQKGSAKIILLLVALLVVGVGVYAYVSGNGLGIIKNTSEQSGDQSAVTSGDNPSPGSVVHNIDNASTTSPASASVGLVIKSTSISNSAGDKPVIATQDVSVKEGQSFYFNEKLKPYITKPIFKLEKINSATSISLSYTNQVYFLVNNAVFEKAANPFVLTKGSEQCFVTTWDDSGYKFCIILSTSAKSTSQNTTVSSSNSCFLKNIKSNEPVLTLSYIAWTAEINYGRTEVTLGKILSDLNASCTPDSKVVAKGGRKFISTDLRAKESCHQRTSLIKEMLSARLLQAPTFLLRTHAPSEFLKLT